MPDFQKRDIARSQLETAVDLFFRGLSHHAVITLAGADSGILSGLAHAAGKGTFVAAMACSRLALPAFCACSCLFITDAIVDLAIRMHKTNAKNLLAA